jgi:biopolymer transport protein ExbD
MVTSHFDVVSGVRIRLPKMTKKIYNVKTQKVIIMIDKDGQIFMQDKKFEMENLRKKLEELVKKEGPFQLVLQADKDVKHGKVVQIMDLAKTAGVGSILIAARWDSDRIF